MKCCATLHTVLLAIVAAVQSTGENPEVPVSETFMLWQLPNQTSTQIMSYVIPQLRVYLLDGRKQKPN